MMSGVMAASVKGMDVRALRRGGLQAMAIAGTPLSVIIQFSKHATEKMLMRYLQHGIVALHHGQTTASVVEEIEAISSLESGPTN